MKKITLLIISMSIGFIGYAQKKSKVKTHTVTIEKYEVLDSLYFNIGKLLDKRPFKENIGMAQKGAFNKKAIALLPDSLSNYLAPILKEMVPNKPDNKTFDVLVYDLAILEHTGAMKETGYCKLQIEVVKDNLSYGFYDAYIKNNGMDVTAGHGKRIAKAFAACFKEFNNTGLGKAGEPLIIFDDNNFKFPDNLKKGTYTSFNAVIRNKPDSINSFTVEKTGGKKLDKYLLKDVQNQTYKNRKLLYSDGEHLYLHASNFSFDNHYVKAKHYGRYLYFEDRLTDPATAAAMAAAFGMVGMLASNTKQGVILDTETGIVSVLNAKKIKELLKDQPELYKKYEATNKNLAMKELVIIQLNKMHE